MDIKQIAGLVSALTVILGAAFVMDARYLHASDFGSFEQNYMEAEVRDLRKDLRLAELDGDPVWETEVRRDLEHLLNDLCSDYPDSRYCKED